jgi:hypothetical protein
VPLFDFRVPSKKVVQILLTEDVARHEGRVRHRRDNLILEIGGHRNRGGYHIATGLKLRDFSILRREDLQEFVPPTPQIVLSLHNYRQFTFGEAAIYPLISSGTEGLEANAELGLEQISHQLLKI